MYQVLEQAWQSALSDRKAEQDKTSAEIREVSRGRERLDGLFALVQQCCFGGIYRLYLFVSLLEFGVCL